MNRAEMFEKVLTRLIADHPMWDGIDYTMVRESNIADFVDEAAAALDAALAAQEGERGGAEVAAADLLAYFDNGGPDTPIRTTWPEGVECWEVPADDLRPLLLALEAALADPAGALATHDAEVLRAAADEMVGGPHGTNPAARFLRERADRIEAQR